MLDVHSRVIVGWQIAPHIRTDLVLDAIEMATWRRDNPTGLVHHSDAGSVGGVKWSSQHLTMMEVFDGTTARVDGYVDGEAVDAVARSSADPS